LWVVVWVEVWVKRWGVDRRNVGWREVLDVGEVVGRWLVWFGREVR